jgi:hypothetical protein
MRFVSFELATVFLGGHNSLSQARTWKCRGYVRIFEYLDVVLMVADPRLGIRRKTL